MAIHTERSQHAQLYHGLITTGKRQQLVASTANCHQKGLGSSGRACDGMRSRTLWCIYGTVRDALWTLYTEKVCAEAMLPQFVQHIFFDLFGICSSPKYWLARISDPSEVHWHCFVLPWTFFYLFPISCFDFFWDHTWSITSISFFIVLHFAFRWSWIICCLPLDHAWATEVG